MYGVQAAGCAPVVKAFQEGAAGCTPWPEPWTIASGLRVPGPLGDRLMLQALRESGGGAIAVPDAALAAAARDLQTLEGIDASAVGELVRLVERASVSAWVKERAVRAFRLIGDAEGRVHNVPPEKVHLHEVGAVDALLDIVGAIEGFERLGVEAVYNLPIAMGNGWVEAAHGKLPVPAPATAILLEGLEVTAAGGGLSPVEGEATTPTGAARLRVLTSGAPPARWRMARSGWGAGRRRPSHYPNALRLLA